MKRKSSKPPSIFPGGMADLQRGHVLVSHSFSLTFLSLSLLATATLLLHCLSCHVLGETILGGEQAVLGVRSEEMSAEGAVSFIPNLNETETVDANNASASWHWPSSNDANAENQIHSILTSWCSDTYVDAVKESTEKARLFEKLRAERDQRYSDWIRCTQERGIREREVEMECDRSQQAVSGAFERERAAMKTKCDSSTGHLRADLESCEVKLMKKGSAACQKEVVGVRVACEEGKREKQSEMNECEAISRVTNVTQVVELEALAVRAEGEREQQQSEKKKLEKELSECRPAMSKAQNNLEEILEDSRAVQLRRKVMWLQLILLHLLLFLAVAVGFVLFLRLKERPGGVSGGQGWLAVQPASRLRLVGGEEAREHLADAYESSKGQRLATVLTSDVNNEYENGPPTVYLLIPLNITSSRRFHLFNAGGDYSAHVEKAQEIVAKELLNCRLVVVLYEAGGCVFTESTLQSQRLTADKIAYEAVPGDAEFPKGHNLVVLWLDKQEGLRAADSAQESDLTSAIKSQPWAQYLLLRSGRWGQVHAQFL